MKTTLRTPAANLLFVAGNTTLNPAGWGLFGRTLPWLLSPPAGLRPMHPNLVPPHYNASWRASTNPHGSPGGNDP